MEWVAKHLALDEIGVYLQKREITDDPETVYSSLYEYLSEVIDETERAAEGFFSPPGCTAADRPSRIRTPAECSST